MPDFSTIYGDVFTNCYEQNSDDNTLLTLAMVKAMVNAAHVWVAEQTGIYTRSHVMNAIDEQANYAMAADMFAIEDVYWYTTTAPLERKSKYELQKEQSSAWRSSTSGTPSYYYKDSGRTLGLYLKPNVAASEYFTTYGWCIPYAVGTTISTAVRASNVSTITTSAVHGLVTGEYVGIAGVTDTTFVTTSAQVTVTSTTAFTYANTGTNGNSTGGRVYYAGGVLPLSADTDVPAFYAGCHDILSYWAVLKFCTGILADKPQSQLIGPIAARFVDDYLGQLKRGVYR